MGNQILGKRSRSFYMGFNQRQVDYVKEKFSVMAGKQQGKDKQKDAPLVLNSDKFIDEYQLTPKLAEEFFKVMNFDEEGGIDEYEFVCAVHSLCNMTVSELGAQLFEIVTKNDGAKGLKESQLMNFTQVCIMYNATLENKTFQPKEIKKINKDKFKKYDYEKSGSISKDQFVALCSKDEDFKKWFFNMGFITKNQLQFNDQVYDLVDSDVEDQIQRHLTKTDPNTDRLKRGFENKIPQKQDFEEDDDQGDQSVPQGAESSKSIQTTKTKKKELWEADLSDKNPKYCINQTLKQNSNSPSQTLTMKYIFGYRSYDCRDNIKFDSKGNVVYHQAAVGIVMNNKNQQKFMNQHKDDIVCLDVCRNMVVTGEMGTSPSVILWDTKEDVMKSKLIITDQLKESVGNVAFNKAAKDKPEFLAVNCNDSDHTLIVYKIEYKTQGKKQSIEASVKSKGVLSKNAILDLKFTLDSKFIVAASLKEILFMKYDVEILNASRGEFGQFSNSCALCLLPLKGKLIAQKQKNWTLSGMTNGSIYFWEEDKCKIARSGHDGSVSALALVEGDNKNLFISGDKSGKIIVWGKNLVKSYTCTIQKTQGFSNMIVSLSVYDKSEILVGTKSSTVYRATLQQNLILTQKHAIISGHCQGNLWALSVQQTKGSSFFYTGGEDQRLMKWKYGKEYKLEKQIMCKYKIRSLSHCSKQQILAVGFMNGIVQIMTEDLSLFSKDSRFEQLKNPDKEILNLVKFKADGTMLAVCYTNPAKKATPSYKVVFFSWNKGLKKQKQIEFTSKVIALDFVAKGDLVRINTSNNQFDIYDISASKPVLVKSDRYRKVVDQLDWENHTTFMSPQTKGFKIQGVSESDIVCCQRNRNNRNVVLFGDKYSNIKLANYPCATFPIFSKYQGHSNAITAMEFNSISSKDKQGQYLISIGGQEKSIIVWQYDPDEVNNAEYFVKPKQNSENQQDNSFQKAKGQCVNATPHYKGQIKQPGHFKQTCNARRDNKPPKQDLSIQHVFGIRNQYINDEVRNTCKFTADNQSILFPTACLGVQMNIKTKEQTYYHEHKEDIVSFAVDQSRKLMATGQMAQKNVKDPRKKIVSVCVWDLENHKLLKKLDGFHTIAVVLLDFSPSGKLLFSVGNDDKNTFAVYDWKAGSVIYSGPVSGGKVNAISWKNQNEFMTCGMDHVKFWQKGKGKQGKFAGKDKFESMFSCLYYRNEDDGAFLTGGGNGAVFVWRGNQTVSSPREHGTSKQVNPKESKMKVHTIVQKQKSIYTGAEDGFIFQWKIEKDWTLTRVGKIIFDSRSIPKKFKCLIADQKNDKQDEQGILSIDFAKGNNDSVLVVTKGASVVTFRISGGEAQNVDVIHQGHYKGQLWGLGTFQKPGKSKFILTGGDDCTVRKWDLETKSQVGRIYFKNPIRAVDCQQSSDYMIVAADKKAQLFLLANNLQKKSEHRGKPFSKNEQSNTKQGNTKQGAVKFDHFPWVEQIKFSPDGQKVCYGTHAQSQIGEIVPVSSDKFNSKKTKQFKIGTSAVNHIDWSKNGQSIAINTQAWQYLFFNSQSGSALSATSLKDENWASYTRKYGFQSQGIFQGVDHTDINTICRMVTDEDKQNPKGVLAVGYDDQSIRLFSYPAYIKNQVHKQYFGHSSHVTKIKFIEGDHRMVSVGGLDRTVIVWKVHGLAPPEKPKNDDEDDGLDDLDEEVDVPARVFKKKPKRVVEQDFTQVLDQGDQFMAIKPWVGAIKQPTTFFPKSKGQFPKASIQLSYVLGYRAKDCRQNLFYKDADTIIFHAAAVLIQQKISTKKQRLFNDHNDDILSIDYHRQKDIVATGELGPKPLVCVYKEGEFFKSFKAPVIKGVIAIAISPNGENVACVGLDDKHGMAVIELKSGNIVKLSETTNKLITKIKWINNEDIVTVGINYYGEWKYMKTKDSNLIKNSIKKSPKSNNVSLDISPGGDTILVGANFSSLFNYSSNKDGKNVFTLVEKSEEKSQEQKDTPKNVVECIKITDKFIACGMRSGEIFFLQKNLKIKSSIKLQEVLTFDFNYKKSQKLCIRAIDFWPEGSNIRVLVGTLGSQIYQFLIDKNCKPVEQVSSCILKGHFAPNSTWTNEVWGLTIPEGSSDIAISCSDDSTIRIWNISKVPTLVFCHNVCFGKDQSQLIDPKTKQYPDNLRLRAIAVSPNNEYLAVGAFDGTLRIFKLNLHDESNMIPQKALWEKKIAKQWISDIKFGFKTLIVGSHDNAIYVFGFDLANEQREGKDDQRFQDDTLSLKLKYKPMNKHSSYITHLDVSRDSCFLQSTCGAYQILFWDLNAGKQLPGGATMLKNEMWKTWTCNIGWPVQGIYPKEQDGTFINAVDRSNMTVSGEKSYSDKKNSDFFLLAAGNDHGKVAVYNYPSLIKNSNYIEGKGHSSHVTTVRWMADDEHIISVGGEDQCVMVWKVTKNVTSPDEQKCEQKKKTSNSPSKKDPMSIK